MTRAKTRARPSKRGQSPLWLQEWDEVYETPDPFDDLSAEEQALEFPPGGNYQLVFEDWEEPEDLDISTLFNTKGGLLGTDGDNTGPGFEEINLGWKPEVTDFLADFGRLDNVLRVSSGWLGLAGLCNYEVGALDAATLVELFEILQNYENTLLLWNKRTDLPRADIPAPGPQTVQKLLTFLATRPELRTRRGASTPWVQNYLIKKQLSDQLGSTPFFDPSGKGQRPPTFNFMKRTLPAVYQSIGKDGLLARPDVGPAGSLTATELLLLWAHLNLGLEEDVPASAQRGGLEESLSSRLLPYAALSSEYL